MAPKMKRFTKKDILSVMLIIAIAGMRVRFFAGAGWRPNLFALLYRFKETQNVPVL
jgi:hypothetical protein